MLFIRSCSPDEESKVMSRMKNDMRGTLRGAIASCSLLHAAFLHAAFVYAHVPDDDAQ